MLEGRWKIIATVRDGQETALSHETVIEFRGSRLFWPTVRNDGTSMVSEIEIHTDGSPHFVTNRLIGFERDGQLLSLATLMPKGKKTAPGRMTFELAGDTLRIGYENDSRRLLGAEELTSPKGNVAVSICVRLNAPAV